jgi:hypothetical protein
VNDEQAKFCFIITFHNFATLENRLTYRCPSSWLVVITRKKKLAGTCKKKIGYWPVQMNGNKFATGQNLGKLVEVVKGRSLAGRAQKSPKPCKLKTYRTLVCLYKDTGPEALHMCKHVSDT